MNPKVMDAVGVIGRFVADHWESMINQDEIADELMNLGFSNREISDAFKWIERNTLGSPGDTHPLPEASIKPGIRVLSPMEQAKINPSAYSLVTSYYDRGLLDATLLEDIIERAMRSEAEEVEEKELRRITALTLFNRVQAEWRDYLHTTNTLVH